MCRFKTAILKIFYEMLLADGMVCQEEIQLLNTFKSNDEGYSILPEHEWESQFVTLADALSALAEWKQSKDIEDAKFSKFSINRFFSDLLALAEIDGAITLNESRIALSVYYSVVGDARCFSLAEHSFRISKHELVYLDSDDETLFDHEIEQNYNLYNALLKPYGYKFIYVPHEIQYLYTHDQNILNQVFQLTAPVNYRYGYSEADGLNALKRTTNAEFCTKIFHSNSISDLEPTILFKINSALMPCKDNDGKILYNSIANYVCLPIQVSVKETLEKFIHQLLAYNKIVVNQTSIFANEERYIALKGFHKTLIDYMVAQISNSGIGRIVFKMADCVIYFEGVNRQVHLKPRELCVYMLIVYMSQHSLAHGLPALDAPSRQAQSAQTLFGKLYSRISSRPIPNIYETGFSHSITLIKTELEKINLNSDLSKYIPHSTPKSVYIQANCDHIYIKDFYQEQVILLTNWMKNFQ